MVKAVYQLDDNTVPPVCILRPRLWYTIHEQLAEILRCVANSCVYTELLAVQGN